MDAVYNRHVLGPKTTLNLFFPSSGNTSEMGGMSQRLAQFSMLNPFLLLQRNAPQIDTFYYVKVVFWFLFVWHHARKMDAFYVKGVVLTLIFCGIQCPRNGCFLWRVQCDTHVWLNQNASRKDAFHDRWSQCIIFLQGNAPKIDAFCDSGSQCVIAKCPRHGRLLRHRLSM